MVFEVLDCKIDGANIIEIEVQNACLSLRELRFIAPLQQQSASTFVRQNGFCDHKSTTCLANPAH